MRALFEDILLHVTAFFRDHEEHGRSDDALGAANADLRSTNQTRETAKDALQFTNAGMSIVNSELKSRNRDVTQTNSHLLNLLITVDVPIVILDMQQRIRLFTPRATAILNVRFSDHGRLFSEIRSNIDVADLDSQIEEVIQTVSCRESEVQDHPASVADHQPGPRK